MAARAPLLRIGLSKFHGRSLCHFQSYPQRFKIAQSTLCVKSGNPRYFSAGKQQVNNSVNASLSVQGGTRGIMTRLSDASGQAKHSRAVAFSGTLPYSNLGRHRRGQISFFFLWLVSLVDVKVRRNKLRFRFLIVGAVVLLGWIYLIFF